MTFQLEPKIEDYILSHSAGYSTAAKAIVDETSALGDPAVMILAKEQYVFFRFIARLLQTKRVLDVGTFTGLSALAFAEGIPHYGQVVTIDREDAEWLEIARRNWDRAGVTNRIDVHIGEAENELKKLSNERTEPFDIIFLDVDKARTQQYFDLSLPLVADEGLILVDNSLWHRWVLDPERLDPDTAGTRDFNDNLQHDTRVEVVMLPIGDGLTLARPTR
jgi:caffeoyl-CoA O-methyltransferase